MLPIKTVKFGESLAFFARDLHHWFEVPIAFEEWIIDMLSLGFEPLNDFYTCITKSSNGHSHHDYLLMEECAKEICILQKGIKGREFRNYMIVCEKAKVKQDLLDLIENIEKGFDQSD